MDIGRTFKSNSATAIDIVSLNFFDDSTKIGAPSDSCNDLEPIILARSKSSQC